MNERKNRSIMKMARCMVHKKEFSNKLWVEAASTNVFIQNMLPIRAL